MYLSDNIISCNKLNDRMLIWLIGYNNGSIEGTKNQTQGVL